MATSAASKYDQLCAEHEWRVPERYNIAQDVCDKHPRDKPAMIWERYDGARRDLTWGELQDLSNQAANWLASHGVARGDRVAVVLPPTPETAAVFFATWKLGAILLSMSVLYGDDGIRHRLTDSQAKVLVTDEPNAPRFDPAWVEEVLVLGADTLPGLSTDFETADTSAEDPAQLFGPWRYGALQCVFQREGGFDPAKQLDFLSRHEVTNVFTTPTAMRAMMALGEVKERFPQQFRIVCSAGEPLNPEAIRWFRKQYGLTVLDFYGLTESYPLAANYPFMEVRE